MIAGLILYIFSILILQQLLWPQYLLFGVVWNGTGESLLLVLSSSVVEHILLVPISDSGLDIFCWALSRDVNFSLRSSWEFIRGSRNQNEVFSLIWQRHIPSRVSFFFWRLLHSFLVTDDDLCLKGFHMVSRCLCNRDVENIRHLFLDYPVVQQIWRRFYSMIDRLYLSFLSHHALFSHWRRYCRSRSSNHIRVILPCFIL